MSRTGNGVVQTSLVPVEEPPNVGGITSMIERLAARPDFDVAKLEKLIDMQERVLKHQAEAAFNVAFTRMSPEIPTIIERARTDKTTYAPLEDIIEVIRPIYSRHGFSLGFRTEWPSEKTVKVIGVLTHTDGHARHSEFVSLADQTGSKNAIQALASTVSYGKRYVTKDLFCIVTRHEDDDGEDTTAATRPTPPDKYDEWIVDMDALIEGGATFAQYAEAWNKSNRAFRKYVVAHDKARVQRWKVAAQAAQ